MVECLQTFVLRISKYLNQRGDSVNIICREISPEMKIQIEQVGAQICIFSNYDRIRIAKSFDKQWLQVVLL